MLSLHDALPICGKATALTGDGHVGGFDILGNTFVYALDSLNAPADLYLSALVAATKPTRLTDVNADRLAGVQFGYYEQFSFPGSHNDIVHGYVMKPLNYHRSEEHTSEFQSLMRIYYSVSCL